MKEKKLNKKVIIYFLGAIFFIIGLIVLFIMSNQNNSTGILKTEYSIGEVGELDHIKVVLKDVNYANNNTSIDLTFEITNNSKNTITIIPDDYFVFYDVNKVQIPNKHTNNKSIIKKDETLTYKLQYDTPNKELYEVYFYSQVVENNIKFTFKATDIKPAVIDENNIKTEEKEEEE